VNAFSDRQSPAWQIIEYIKRNGSATVKELEELLGVTTTAVRQHLQTLQVDGYVARARVHAGVGRPHHAYSITAKAHELFACHCDDLALTLLEEVYAQEGAARAAQLLARVGDRLARRYAGDVKSDVLRERVEEMAAALYRRGVLTKVLHAYNCPYHDLAQKHRDICAMDAELMRKVLGSEVSLSACMLDGHHGCTFIVGKPATGHAQDAGRSSPACE
jgi:DeoR family suf operon transcriptional repressor